MRRGRGAKGIVATVAGVAALSAPAPAPAAASSGAGDQKPQRVAIVSGTLSTMAFGARVGAPLLCGASAGVITTGVPNPAVAGLVTEAAGACALYSNMFADGLTELNGALAPLAVINPGADPVIDALAGAFTTAGASGMPFGRSAAELGRMVAFFHS